VRSEKECAKERLGVEEPPAGKFLWENSRLKMKNRLL
jgi:hypothetical protein